MKECQINIRVSEEEKELLDKEAKSLNLKRSEYIRNIIFNQKYSESKDFDIQFYTKNTDKTIAILRSQIDFFKKQLIEKDKQLDQQQQLTLKNLQIQEQLQLELGSRKEELLKLQKSKKWYQFWK